MRIGIGIGMKKEWVIVISLFFLLLLFHFSATLSKAQQTDFKVLSTSKTSTMQKEMNEAAKLGFRYEGVMGGETSFGGDEAVVIMSKEANTQSKNKYEYRLLATKKTSTMQKEMKALGEEGFEYKGQTVFNTTFGGKEVVVIMERNPDSKTIYEYQLLATKKTSTMQKELQEAGNAGYSFVGITVAETSFGGNEVVVILKKN